MLIERNSSLASIATVLVATNFSLEDDIMVQNTGNLAWIKEMGCPVQRNRSLLALKITTPKVSKNQADI